MHGQRQKGAGFQHENNLYQSAFQEQHYSNGHLASDLSLSFAFKNFFLMCLEFILTALPRGCQTIKTNLQKA
jgi:hypothetical protein